MRFIRKGLGLALGVAVAAWVGGCGSGGEQATPSSTLSLAAPSYREVHEKVLSPRCVQCHSNSRGNSGDVNLETYSKVRLRLERIQKRAIQDRTMPPRESGPLTEWESALLVAWIRAGAPEGASGASSGVQPSGLPSPGAPGSRTSFETIRTTILKPKCLGCHGSGGEAEEIPLDSVRSLLDQGLCVPGDALKSPLYQSVSRSDAKRMPPNGSGIPSLSVEELATLRKWIENLKDDGTDSGPGSDHDPDPLPPPRPTHTPTATPTHTPTHTPTPSPTTPDPSPTVEPSSAPTPWPSHSPLPIEPSWESISQRLLQPRCLGCHRTGGVGEDYPLDSLKGMIAQRLVVPGRPERSILLKAVTRTDERRMPPLNAGIQPLGEPEIAALRKWITELSPERP